MGRLDGRDAPITGCRRGFGETMAELFASEGAKSMTGQRISAGAAMW